VRGSNFLLLPVYLKLMSQNDFGLYTYLYSMIGAFSLIINFGLYLSQSKLYHDYKEEERGSLLFTINAVLFVSLFVLFVPIYTFHLDGYLIKLMFSHPFNYAAYREIILLALIVSVYIFMTQNFFMTSENIKKYQVYNFLRLVIVNGIVIYALAHKNPDSALVRLKYCYLVELPILLGFSWHYIKAMKFRVQMKFVRKAIKIGYPAMLSAVLGMIFNFSDKFILEKYGNFSDLAVYNLGFTLATILMVIFASFQAVYQPLFFKEKNVKNNLEKTFAISLRIALIFTVLGIAIFFGVKFMLDYHIIQWKYSAVLFILPILLLTQGLQAILQLFLNYITYFEVVYVGTIVSLVLSVVNVSLNLILIPRFNIYGASISALANNLLALAFYYYYVQYKCKKAIKQQAAMA
jgi:O-antigen/teichoic acid export membrane protein